jgi:hypothetical protein
MRAVAGGVAIVIASGAGWAFVGMTPVMKEPLAIPSKYYGKNGVHVCHTTGSIELARSSPAKLEVKFDSLGSHGATGRFRQSAFRHFAPMRDL